MQIYFCIYVSVYSYIYIYIYTCFCIHIYKTKMKLQQKGNTVFNRCILCVFKLLGDILLIALRLRPLCDILTLILCTPNVIYIHIYTYIYIHEKTEGLCQRRCRIQWFNMGPKYYIYTPCFRNCDYRFLHNCFFLNLYFRYERKTKNLIFSVCMIIENDRNIQPCFECFDI